MANLQERHGGGLCAESSWKTFPYPTDGEQVSFCSPCWPTQEGRHDVHASVTVTASSRSEAPLSGTVAHVTGAMARFNLDGTGLGQVQVAQQGQGASGSHHTPIPASQPLWSHHTPIPASQPLCQQPHSSAMSVVDLISAPRPPVKAPRNPTLSPPESSSVVSIYPCLSFHKQPNSLSPSDQHQQYMHAFTFSANGTTYGPSTRPSGGAARPSGGAARPSGGAARPSGGAARPSGGAARPSGGAARPSGGPARPSGRPARLVSPPMQTNPFLQPFSTDHTPLCVVKQATSKIVMAGCSTELSFCVEDQLRRDIRYQWFLGQHQLIGMTSPHLLISNANSNDEGLYICRATVLDAVSMATPNGAIHLFSDWAEVRVSEQHGQCPTIVVQPCPVIAHYGRHVKLRCEAVGAPEPSYQWYHNGYVLADETHSVLRIERATEQHCGYYSCKVENEHGGRASNIVQVHIHMSDSPEPPPTPKDSNAPTIIQQPQSHQVEHGSRIQLSCSVQGVEPFHYQWYKDNVPLSKSSTQEHIIAQCCDGDSGLYICHISNMYGEQWSNPARVAVKPKPVTPAVVWPSPTTTLESYQVTAMCSTYTQCSANSPQRYQNGRKTAESNGCHPVTSVVTAGSSVADCARSPGSKTGQERWQHSLLCENISRETTLHSTEELPADVGCVLDLHRSLCTTDPPPVIYNHPPAHLTISIGNSLSLACQARSLRGQQLTYHWLKDSCPLPGETNAELHLCVDHVGCAGTYVCEITDGGQPAYSHPCCVSVS